MVHPVRIEADQLDRSGSRTGFTQDVADPHRSDPSSLWKIPTDSTLSPELPPNQAFHHNLVGGVPRPRLLNVVLLAIGMGT